MSPHRPHPRRTTSRGRAFPAGAALMLLAGCAATPSTHHVHPHVREEIEAFLEEWNAAVAAGDRDAIRAAYAGQGRLRWFEDGVLRYRSADGILAALDRFPPGARIRTALSDLAVEPIGADMAHGSADFETRINFPQGELEFDGVFTMLLERTESGWVFATGHTSTAGGPPAE